MKKNAFALFFSTLLTTLLAACCGNRQPDNGSVSTIGVEEFATAIKQENVLLIDVRTAEEYAEGHLQGAENIDVKANDFAEKTKDIKGSVAVYCRGGKRSNKAARQLAAQGCTVYDLAGGITAWKRAGMPVTK